MRLIDRVVSYDEQSIVCASNSHRTPDHPLADGEGYIHMPNVNVVEEMANMISASRSYQSNVEVVNTSKQLLLRTLALGQ